MWSLIILAIIATAFAIGGYQLVIRKYYWGPKGDPNKRQKNKPG
jgi:hypothetical protein